MCISNYDAVAIVSVLLLKIDMMNTISDCTSSDGCMEWLGDGAFTLAG